MLRPVVVLLLISLSASFSTQAALVTHFGYTLDTETNIVTGNGLEWLPWGQTSETSLSDAVNFMPSWRLATIDEMGSLLDAFSPLSVTGGWASSAGHSAHYSIYDPEYTFDPLFEIMGTTAPTDPNEFLFTGALFAGSNENSHSLFTIESDRLSGSTDVEAKVDSGAIFYDVFPGDSEISVFTSFPVEFSDAAGLALVRSVPELSASAAPISILLLSSLLCLGVERRRRKQKT
jgi:hypothetical protein